MTYHFSIIHLFPPSSINVTHNHSHSSNFPFPPQRKIKFHRDPFERKITFCHFNNSPAMGVSKRVESALSLKTSGTITCHWRMTSVSSYDKDTDKDKQRCIGVVWGQERPQGARTCIMGQDPLKPTSRHGYFLKFDKMT